MNLIKIMDKEIVPVLYQGVPVLTLRQVDELHQRPSGTTRACFNRHRAELVEGEDYFELLPEVWSTLVVHQTYDQRGGHKGRMVFLTESGYLLVTKPFTDKRSWQVQRVLVRSYFMVRDALTAAPALPPRTIEVEEADWWKLRAELAELKLEKAVSDKRKRRAFAPAERATMDGLKGQGYPNRAIAERIGRSVDSVETYFWRKRKQGD